MFVEDIGKWFIFWNFEYFIWIYFIYLLLFNYILITPDYTALTGSTSKEQYITKDRAGRRHGVL
jgi:hypothetical protein